MTKDARFKKKVRQYMADHGVNYTTARRKVLEQQPGPIKGISPQLVILDEIQSVEERS
jgi:phage terminase large subunit-like protein